MMLGLALASLAPTAEAAPVAVEFEDSDALLRGVVIQRLLEGGRVLAPADSPAAVHLSIRWLRHSVLVEGWWGRSRVFREIDHGDPELAVLEVAHGTLDVLERLGADEPEATVVAERVTLEFVGFLPDPRLYAEVTQALLDAGFVVIGRGRGGDWSLCVWQGPEGTYAADRVEAPPCPEQPSVAGDASLGRRVAEVAEHAAEANTEALAEQVSAQTRETRSRPTTVPRRRAPSRLEVETKREPAPAWFELHFDGGAHLRLPGVDGGSHVSFGVGAGRFGAGARLEFLPTVSRVRVLDTIVVAGPSVGWAAGRRARMRLHLLAGVLVHHAEVDDDGHVVRRTDFNGLLHWVTDFPLRKGWGLHLGVGVGLGSRARSHVNLETREPLWSRGAARVGLVTGFHYRRTWRRGG